MPLIIKQYDPTHPKRRVARRTQEQAANQRSLSGPLDDEHFSPFSPESSFDCHGGPRFDEGDLIPMSAVDGVGDPNASYPSVEECLSFCSSATNVSSVCTPASAIPPACQTDASVWKGQDFSIENEDDARDSSSQTTKLNMVDAASAVLLLRDDPRQSCAAPAPAFPDAIAQGSSTFESSTRSLAQSAEALRVLASAATTAEEGVKGTSPAESAQALGTGTFRSKRPLLELDASGGSKGHDSENSPSPKRRRRSGFDSRLSARLTSDITHSTPIYSYANRGVSPPGQVPEEAGLQSPRTPASRAVSSSAPTGDGISLADIKQLLEDQTRQLLDSQTRQISLLAAEVESLKRKVDSSSQVEEWYSNGNDDGDGDGDGDGDSDSGGDSTELKSAQRRKWTPSDEALLERLKLVQSNNNGMPSDHVIAEKLNRSVDAVKQHWTIMQKTGRQNGKAHNEKARRKRRKGRLSR